MNAGVIPPQSLHSSTQRLLVSVLVLSTEQILEEIPDLEMDDLKAVLQYAARKLDHRVLVP